MQLFKERISFLVSSKLKIKEDLISLIEIPPDQKLGDLSLPCFNLAKTLKKSPVEISKSLSELSDIYFSKIEAKGPYLNFFINPTILSSIVIKEILKHRKKRISLNRLLLSKHSKTIFNRPFKVNNNRLFFIQNL